MSAAKISTLDAALASSSYSWADARAVIQTVSRSFKKLHEILRQNATIASTGASREACRERIYLPGLQKNCARPCQKAISLVHCPVFF